MEDSSEQSSASVPESPKPLAYTIDLGINKNVDTHRQKALAEKFQNRHKRGQSLSKLEDSTTTTPPKHPSTGNLPRKSSFQSEGYFSSDEKPERAKSATPRANSAKRSDLTLFLKNVTSDRMVQSFPSVTLPSISSPELELKDVSSPELDSISPFSPIDSNNQEQSCSGKLPGKVKQFLSPDCEKLYIGESEDVFVDGTEYDFDKSDTASDAGTYTLDAENYSEEQKVRMSIDKDFKIEQVSVQKKTEEYIKSLSTVRDHVLQNTTSINKCNIKYTEVTKGIQNMGLINYPEIKSPMSPTAKKVHPLPLQLKKTLSPIMSPTQNMSITEDISKADSPSNNIDCDKTFTKIMFPSPIAKQDGLQQNSDQGSVISVTSSGAFKPKVEKKPDRRFTLTKSEVHIQAYVDGKSYSDVISEPARKRSNSIKLSSKLTANIVNVQSIELKNSEESNVIGKMSNITSALPPAVGGHTGKMSPTKIPSPIHTLSRPRSRNSLSSLNVELSDNSLDTDSILKPTQNYINTLQQRLSLDSDPDSDYDVKYGLQLNNTAHLLKQKASHTRHNSLDDRTMNISNKLEHFQNKNLQGIEQTYTNLLNQYSQNRVMHKIQNSPNNSPIRRSSSFSTKNSMQAPKNTNVFHKETNICNSPNGTRNTSIQRSSSTACIKPNFVFARRGSISDHQKIDRSQFGDTESSSEDDYEKSLQKRKDLSNTNITNTRCNRAFSLRRARADNDTQLKCPNTPEMRRKAFQPDHKPERAISVDRKPMKSNDVQSRYLMNIAKRASPSPAAKESKPAAKMPSSVAKTTPNRLQMFSRTDSGRFSMRTSKPPLTNNVPKSLKKDPNAKKGGGRSNSSLSSREVEFQNWKRRKSYDPMKAAAEDKKKKELAKRQGPAGVGANPMTQSYTEANHSQDSSPSHSSSVHRSQSFHGTAALEQLLSSEEDDDLTLSADEGFSPPTPSPCELSPARASLRHALWEHLRH